MKKATLVKLSDNKNELRTRTVTGHFMREPTPGNSFFLHAESLDPELDARYIATSIVRKVVTMDNGDINFETLNSVYRLTNVEDVDA